MARLYVVTLPIAGHAILEVEAENEKEAIELAMGKVTIQDIEEWETLHRFIKGNLCYCPTPWEAEATDEGEAS